MAEVVLVRHGQTEWARDARHTGRSDVPLTAAGEADAQLVLSAGSVPTLGVEHGYPVVLSWST